MTLSPWPTAPTKGPDGVGVARAGGVLTLTLDRPTDQNRLTRDVLVSLQSIADRLRDDGEIQAVVMTGSGSEFFSMGILNPAVRAGYTKDQILELVRLANRLYDALEALPQIVIVAINGIARAGAAELSLACDIRLAASHATWALPEALWGGFPGAGGPVRLPAIVGRARALELICTGRGSTPRRWSGSGWCSRFTPAGACSPRRRSWRRGSPPAGPSRREAPSAS